MYSAFTCYVTAALRVRALVMKTTLMAHLSLAPYKESVTIVQIQMPFYAAMRSWTLLPSYAPGLEYIGSHIKMLIT